MLFRSWNAQNGTWMLDINTPAGAPILNGIPLVANVDLLQQFGYLNLGGQLIVQTDGNANLLPTYDNLGINSHLYFVVS